MERNAQDWAGAAWQDVWIAFPAFQEAATIRSVAQAALQQCTNVIVVDRGKAASLRTAFAHALERGAACVITLDGDGQHEPLDAAALLAAWRREPERRAIGSRLHDRSRFPLAWPANRFAYFWISWAAGHPIADSQSGSRLYPAAVMRIALGRGVRGSRFTFESEILIEAARRGHRTLAVAIAGRYPPNARASRFRPVWDISKIVLMVGGRLLRSGVKPLGLWRSLQPALVLPGRATAPPAQCASPAMPAGDEATR